MMKNFVLFLIFISLGSCISIKNIKVVNRVGNCLNNNDIETIAKSYFFGKKENKLFITRVEFDTINCIGLFRFEYSKMSFSVSNTTYALKFKNNIKIQSKNISRNENVLDRFFLENNEIFTVEQEKYIRDLFLSEGVIGRVLSNPTD